MAKGYEVTARAEMKRPDPWRLAGTLWAAWTALVFAAAALLLAFGAVATGKAAYAAPLILAFFGVPAVAAGLSALPVRARGPFAVLRVRPGTVAAVLLRFAAYFYALVAFGGLYALFTVELPSPDGLYYALMPLVVVALAGGAYYTWRFEALTFPEIGGTSDDTA